MRRLLAGSIDWSRRRLCAGSAEGQSGFSLVELLVAMVVLIVVMGATFGIWLGLENVYTFTNDDMVAQEQARTAMGEMVELIRTARRPATVPDEALNAVMPVAGRTELTVWSDVDRAPDHGLELIRFRADHPAGAPNEQVLYRDQATVGASSRSWTSERLVTPNVSNWFDPARPSDETGWLFSYYNGAGERLLFDDEILGYTGTIEHVIPDPNSIREVRINLLVDLYKDRAPITHQLTSVVQPRNLRQY